METETLAENLDDLLVDVINNTNGSYYCFEAGDKDYDRIVNRLKAWAIRFAAENTTEAEEYEAAADAIEAEQKERQRIADEQDAIWQAEYLAKEMKRQAALPPEEMMPARSGVFPISSDFLKNDQPAYNCFKEFGLDALLKSRLDQSQLRYIDQ